MINKTIIATTIADKPAIAQFSETPARGPAFSETGRHQASQTYKNMKKLTIGTSLFSLLAGVMLSSCASDKAATESTTTTRQTTVTQPAATQTTTQTTRY
jgi:cytosine/uracil/thiamine/allantoin permease